MLSKVFGWRGAAFVFGWIMVVGLATKLIMNTGEEMFTFNPYKILGVEEGAEMSAVKKAYRRLSLQYHVRCLPASLRQQEPPLLSRSQSMAPLLPASAPRMARRRRAGQLSFALRSALVRVHGVWAADSPLRFRSIRPVGNARSLPPAGAKGSSPCGSPFAGDPLSPSLSLSPFACPLLSFSLPPPLAARQESGQRRGRRPFHQGRQGV